MDTQNKLVEDLVDGGGIEETQETAQEVAIELSKEATALKIHTDARDQRVLAVHQAIVSAKVIRDAQEVKGLIETDGARLDRLIKEEEALKQASVLKVIENFSAAVDIGNPAFQIVVDKLNEVITFLNGSNSVVK